MKNSGKMLFFLNKFEKETKIQGTLKSITTIETIIEIAAQLNVQNI